MADTAKDIFVNDQATVDGPANGAFLITPHDTNTLVRTTSGITCGTNGALRVTTSKGDDVVIPATVVAKLPVIPIRAVKVWATNTGASDIIGWYSK